MNPRPNSRKQIGGFKVVATDSAIRVMVVICQLYDETGSASLTRIQRRLSLKSRTYLWGTLLPKLKKLGWVRHDPDRFGSIVPLVRIELFVKPNSQTEAE